VMGRFKYLQTFQRMAGLDICHGGLVRVSGE
jgi:hypothetical protein